MKKYRDFIRSLPCSVCSTQPSEIHHLIDIEGVDKGMARKLPDIIAIPLCREHHRALHADLMDFEEWYGTQGAHLAKTLLLAKIEGEVQYAE